MALEAGTLLRIRYEAEVRQAPSLTSPLLHVAQVGRLVKQLAEAVDVEGGRRVPLVPRGWIDAAAVEPAGDCEGPRQPTAGAAAASSPAPPAATGSELLELLGDGRRPRRRCAPDAGLADQPAAESWTRPDEDAAKQREGRADDGQRSGEGDGRWQADSKGKSGSNWWESNDRWAENSWAQEDGGWSQGWSEDSRWKDGRSEQRRQEVPAAAAADAWRQEPESWAVPPQPQPAAPQQQPQQPQQEEQQWWATFSPDRAAGVPAGWGDAAASEGPESGVLFSGVVVRADFLSDEAVLDCHEARAVFGSGDITVSSRLLPMGSEPGSTLCFALRGGSQGGPPRPVPGSLAVADASAARTAVLAGTVKSFSRRQTGERLGWLTSAATQSTYACDVYVHGSMLEGLGIGDAVAFSVHENARGQPQASINSVVKIGSAVAGGAGEGAGPATATDGMDAPTYAPGRVVFGSAADAVGGDLLESLLTQARQDAGIPAKPQEHSSIGFMYQ